MAVASATPWYAAGLQFSCRGCHGCCHVHGENRRVYLSAGELEGMAAALGQSDRLFKKRYCLPQEEQQAQWALRFESTLCPLHDGKGVQGLRCAAAAVRHLALLAGEPL